MGSPTISTWIRRVHWVLFTASVIGGSAWISGDSPWQVLRGGSWLLGDAPATEAFQAASASPPHCRSRFRAASGCRGKVREVSRWVLEQAHDQNGPVRRERAGATCRRRRPVRRCLWRPASPDSSSADVSFPRRSRGHRYPDRSARHGSFVVHARDRGHRVGIARVDEPQHAHLIEVLGRVEEHHPVLAVLLRHKVVHRGQEPVPSCGCRTALGFPRRSTAPATSRPPGTRAARQTLALSCSRSSELKDATSSAPTAA